MITSSQHIVFIISFRELQFLKKIDYVESQFVNDFDKNSFN